MQTISKTIQRSLLALTLIAGLGCSHSATAAMEAIEEAIVYSLNRKTTAGSIIKPAGLAALAQFTSMLASIEPYPKHLESERTAGLTFLRNIRNFFAAIAFFNLARARLNIAKDKETHSKKKLLTLNTVNALRHKIGNDHFDLASSFLPTTTFNFLLSPPRTILHFYILPSHLLPDGRLVIRFLIQHSLYDNDYAVYYVTIDGKTISPVTDVQPLGLSDRTKIEDPFVGKQEDSREARAKDGRMVKIKASRHHIDKDSLEVTITVETNPLSSGLRISGQRTDIPAAPAPEKDMAPAYPASFIQVGPRRAAAPAAPPEAMESKRG